MRSFVPILLALLACPVFASENPAPTQEQQNTILGNIGSFVENYISTLPNLICVKTTEQYKGNKNGDRWKQLDTLTSRLTLVKGREKATLERVNNKPLTDIRRVWRAPLTTEGEFGDMLAVVLSRGSNATLSWRGWETLNGKHVAVFGYSIDQAHSSLNMHFSDLASAVLPYSGSLYADPDSGTVWRVTDFAKLPPEFHATDIQTTLDYNEVTISGKTLLLPVHATVVEHGDSGTNRNEITFSDYRKFEAESTITFGDGAPPQK